MSQKDMEILIQLKPLETLFNSLSDEKAKLYCKHLQPFDLDTIRAAVDKVAGEWDRLSFPPPGVIVTACAARATGGRSDGHRMTFPWEERLKNRAKAINEYMAKFKNYPAFQEAEKAGYASELMRYVWECASVQAQCLFPYPDGRLALCWYVVHPQGLEEGTKWQFNRDFLRDARAQAERGYIDVAIPTTKLHEWQESAARTRARQQVSAPQMSRKYGQQLSEILEPLATREPPQEILPPLEAYADASL